MVSVSLVVNLSISVKSITPPALGIHLRTKWLASGLLVSSLTLRGCFGCAGAGVSSFFALLIVLVTESSVSLCPVTSSVLSSSVLVAAVLSSCA